MKIPMFRSFLFFVLLCVSIGQTMANDSELPLKGTTSGDGNRKSSRSIESEPIDYPIQQTTLQIVGTHQNHFHVYLQSPDVMQIVPATQHLLVATSDTTMTVAGNEKAGDNPKLITPEIYRKIGTRLQNLGACIDIWNRMLAKQFNSTEASNSVAPGIDVAGELADFGIKVQGSIIVRITHQPMHGSITYIDTTTGELDVSGNGGESVQTGLYLYTPDKTYDHGSDKVAFEVKVNGYAFHLSYEFHVLSQPGGPDQCPIEPEGDESLQNDPNEINEAVADSSGSITPAFIMGNFLAGTLGASASGITLVQISSLEKAS